MEHQFDLCKDLFQAVARCLDGCRVPSSLNAALLQSCQCLVLEAVQLQQDANLNTSRHCLEIVVQLLSRVSCLGAIEAFFTADDLLVHYQRQLDAIAALTAKLCQQRQQGLAVSSAQQASGCSPNCSTSKLELPEQHSKIVRRFRSYAAQLCPRLLGSCSSEVLQQLCEVVQQGLVMVNGHTFLIDQDWQYEVSAMLRRAEQLKVLLAHRQAHHLTLLATLLQYMHRQELQEFESPQVCSRLNTGATCEQLHQPQVCRLLSDYPVADITKEAAGTKAVAAVTGQLTTGQQEVHVVVAAGVDAMRGGLHVHGGDEDEFYIPVAPLTSAKSSAVSSPTSSRAAASAVAGPGLPFDFSLDGSSTVDMSDDSLARMPSSGCSSLLEYVQQLPNTALGHADKSSGDGSEQRSSSPMLHHQHYSSRSNSGVSQQLGRITEEQLQHIVGPEAAPMIAAALGVVLQGDRSRGPARTPCADSSRRTGVHNKSSGLANSTACAAVDGGNVSACQSGSRQGLVDAAVKQVTELRISTDDGSRCGSPLSRSSSTNLQSSPTGSNRASSASFLQRWQQHQQHRLETNRSSEADAGSIASSSSAVPMQRSSTNRHAHSTLRLQHTHLPAGCCKSIGAVLYMSPHITRLELIDVGIDDEAVVQLVSALKVNSSVLLLDMSHNAVDDIGARALAKLLRQHSSCSSRLRVLYLQHNSVGDDGAIALASGLASNSQLHKLWLQHNAIGAAGAHALATAMQHNTACTSLKLLQGNDGVPKDIGHMAQKLARHNRGIRDKITGLLFNMLKKKDDET